MKEFLVFLLPPLLGAIIGWVTNALAIKMLFRPLAEKRIFGLRLPFTPGILPRQRAKLSKNIGSMVQRELITQEMLLERLQEKSIQDELAKTIHSWTSSLVEKTPAELLSLFNTFFTDKEKEAASVIIQSFIDKLLDSPSFLHTIERLIASACASAKDDTDAENTALTKPSIVTLIFDILDAQFLDRPILNEEQFSRLFLLLFPKARLGLYTFLDLPEIRRALEKLGRTFLDENIQKMNSLQRFFVSAAQYDTDLSSRMGEIIESLVNNIKQYLSSAEAEFLIKLRLFASLEKTISLKPSALAAKIRSAIKTEDFSFAAVLADPALFYKDLAKMLVHLLKTRGKHLVIQRAKKYLEEQKGINLNILFPWLNNIKNTVDIRALGLFNKLASEKIPQILQKIDIEDLVVRRIDSLEMIQVEGIVLDVLADQLKWINVFGAILGAAIGGIQVLLAMFI